MQSAQMSPASCISIYISVSVSGCELWAPCANADMCSLGLVLVLMLDVALDAALIIFEPLDSLVHKLIKMYLNASKYEATRCEDGRWKRWPFGVTFA